MEGKVVVITGGTSGIGQVAAEQLASMGARLILVGRDRARIEQELSRLRTAAPHQRHSSFYADLSSMREVQHVATEIAGAEPRVDVLINNAGALMGPQREETVDGLERTFATNHMAYFVLTAGLLERLKAATPSRIINTTSDRAMVAKLAFDDLQSTRHYKAMDAYCKSKLCNIYFTRVMAKRLDGTGVTVNSWNPGFTKTRFYEGKPFSLRFLNGIIGGDPSSRIETLVYLASAPDVARTTGAFWASMEPGRMSAASQDDVAANKLWRASEQIVAEKLRDPTPASVVQAPGGRR